MHSVMHNRFRIFQSPFIKLSILSKLVLFAYVQIFSSLSLRETQCLAMLEYCEGPCCNNGPV